MERFDTEGPGAFAGWLLAQDKSGKWYADLAKAARADRGFPKHGDIVAVHGRMIAQGADGDTIAMLEDAVADWRSAGGEDDLDLTRGH
jgi:hypothetical protein